MDKNVMHPPKQSIIDGGDNLAIAKLSSVNQFFQHYHLTAFSMRVEIFMVALNRDVIVILQLRSITTGRPGSNL
jgi:hypothetical protein